MVYDSISGCVVFFCCTVKFVGRYWTPLVATLGMAIQHSKYHTTQYLHPTTNRFLFPVEVCSLGGRLVSDRVG